MRKLFYLLIAMLVLMSCGNGSKKKNEENKAEEIQPNRIEVLYFHGKQRCTTCKAIEKYTKERNDVSLAGRLKPIQ